MSVPFAAPVTLSTTPRKISSRVVQTGVAVQILRFLARRGPIQRGRIKTAQDVFIFYTTCPRCSKAYGKNHRVGVAQA
ncbi:hydrolase [Sulfitobacter sp. MF3-043]|uniref:hydrolase n=1 Tax=Sulfitobacter sediminivivens TaxID=3252902 RepID=UPI0036DA9D68